MLTIVVSGDLIRDHHLVQLPETQITTQCIGRILFSVPALDVAELGILKRHMAELGISKSWFGCHVKT